MMREHTRHERGFTVIEVLIAVLLLMTVASTVTLAFASGTRVEQRRDTTTRLTATAERVYEHLRADKGWIEDCRRPSPSSPARTCNPLRRVSGSERTRLTHDAVLDATFDVTTSAEGIDNSGDELGTRDLDGNPDDFFRVEITVSVPRADRGRLGQQRPLTVTSIINGSDTNDTGALVLGFCGAANQIDERISIASCPRRYTWFDMPDCAGEAGCTPRSLFGRTPPASPLQASRMVAVEPLRPSASSLRIVKQDAPDRGMTFDGSAAVWDNTTKTYKFADLPTGRWELSSFALPGWIPWSTHHIPSALNDRPQLTVERGRSAVGLVAMQRPGSSGAFNMKFDRKVHERWLKPTSVEFETEWIPECEEPASTHRSAFGTTQVTCNAPHMKSTWTGGGSVTACAEGLCDRIREYQSWGYYKEIVTVKYIAEERRDTYTWNGAADDAVFSTQPEPAGRYTVRTQRGNSRATYEVPGDRWKVEVDAAPTTGDARANTTRMGVGRARIRNVPLGLNDGIELRPSSSIGSIEKRYSPAGCDKRYTWVTPGGSFGSGSCNSLHFTGQGECYQTVNRNWTGIRYTRHLGCNGIWWPPVGMVTRPGYLIVEICTRRMSRISSWQERVVDGWTAGTLSLPADEWRPHMESNGYTIYETGSHTVGGRTVDGLRAYKRTGGTPAAQEVYNRCQSTPTVNRPLLCRQLDDWTNCNTTYRVVIPRTDGWNVGDGIPDGQRPNNSGSSLSDLG